LQTRKHISQFPASDGRLSRSARRLAGVIWQAYIFRGSSRFGYRRIRSFCLWI